MRSTLPQAFEIVLVRNGEHAEVVQVFVCEDEALHEDAAHG